MPERFYECELCGSLDDAWRGTTPDWTEGYPVPLRYGQLVKVCITCFDDLRRKSLPSLKPAPGRISDEAVFVAKVCGLMGFVALALGGRCG